MNERDFVAAGRALSEWFHSQQDIHPSERAIVAVYWLAVEIAMQGETEERLAKGLSIVQNMLAAKTKHVAKIAKAAGLRK